MTIDSALLDKLSEAAKASPRLRMNFDLRNGESDLSQRMLNRRSEREQSKLACYAEPQGGKDAKRLNAVEPGTMLPVHRHRGTSETVCIVRGRVVQHFYDESGVETEALEMYPGCEAPVVNVEAGRWHRLESLESGSVILECKDGAWEPLAEEDVMK